MKDQAMASSRFATLFGLGLGLAHDRKALRLVAFWDARLRGEREQAKLIAAQIQGIAREWQLFSTKES